MITDDMLRNAAVKANDALLSTLPCPKDCEHVFSKRFERKMRKLIRHTKYPVVYNVLKTAACFILVSILAAAMFLSVNVKAREAFFKWVKAQYEYFIEYYFDGMVSDEVIEDNEMAEYRLGWVPEGYVENKISKSSGTTTITYVNNYDKCIILSYHSTPNSTNLFFYDERDYIYHSIDSSIIADIYIANNDSESNIIVWTDDKVNTLFTISAFEDTSILKKLAENIIQKKI